MSGFADYAWLSTAYLAGAAIMIVISAGVLVLYDARRLLAMFVTNQPVPPAVQPTLFDGRMPKALRWTIKAALVGSVAALIPLRSASSG